MTDLNNMKIGSIMPATLEELREEKVGVSVTTSHELTLLLPLEQKTLKFGEKPSHELIRQLIDLTGAYKAFLKEVRTTETEYQGKEPHTLKITTDAWNKANWLMEPHNTTLGGKLHV